MFVSWSVTDEDVFSSWSMEYRKKFVVFGLITCLCFTIVIELCSECFGLELIRSSKEKTCSCLCSKSINGKWWKERRRQEKQFYNLHPAPTNWLLCSKTRSFWHHVENQLNTNNKSVKAFHGMWEILHVIADVLNLSSKFSATFSQKSRIDRRVSGYDEIYGTNSQGYQSEFFSLQRNRWFGKFMHASISLSLRSFWQHFLYKNKRRRSSF